MSSRYVKRPKVGDVLETGRYGMVTVSEVHDYGRVLVVRSLRGFETMERAEAGWWVRLRTADGVAVPPRAGAIVPTSNESEYRRDYEPVRTSP